MKKVRKGFTLIELLIVVAIIGALSAMMAASSSESIDASAAAAILNNLQTMKTAAFEMYMEEPKVASLTTVNNEATITITPASGEESSQTPAVTKKISEYLGERLGRKDLATNYGIIGDGTAWYVYYTLTDADTTNVKTKLKDAANKAGLLGATEATVEALGATTTTYYNATDTETVVALRVR